MCRKSLRKTIYFLIVFFISFYSLYPCHCDLISLEQVLEKDNTIEYKNCFGQIPFDYQKLPFDRDYFLHPYTGIFLNSYIVIMPQGQVFGHEGSIIFDKKLVYDFVWQNCFIPRFVWTSILEKNIVNLDAKVAVLAQAGYGYYYHWLVEVLGRLALLEIENVQYDYLYVPYNKKFIQESLELWGIDQLKIIEATDDYILQAEQLIIPSLVAKTETNGCPRLSHYIPEYILEYIKNKLLQGYQNQNKNIQYNFSKKVFISREDAKERKMLNELDVFKVFEKHGFEKYILGQMSLVEQIALFKEADIIIGSLGSGMTNIIFCKPDVKIFDIFQKRCDCTIFYMSQTLGLEYHPIKTMDFIDTHDGQYDAIVPLESLNQILQYL